LLSRFITQANKQGLSGTIQECAKAVVIDSVQSIPHTVEPHQRGPLSTFPILGRAGVQITTLDTWLLYAPPAGGEAHWRDRRSAKELARRWLPGRIPPEIERLLQGTDAFREFVAERAYAETKTQLDRYGGNTRNHDLIVKGRIVGRCVNLDVEGKADETFGKTIGARLHSAEGYREQNPRSNAASRVKELSAAVFGREPKAVSDLRYQLLHAVAATAIRARQDGAHQTALIVHQFHSMSLRARQLESNAADLAALVATLGGDPSELETGTRLVGPFFLQGSERIPADVAIYIGKAVYECEGNTAAD
jgi:hypothetical protein